MFNRQEVGAPVSRPRILTSLGAKAADEAGLSPPPPDSQVAPEEMATPSLPGATLPVLNLTAPLPTAEEFAQRVRAAPPPAPAPAESDSGSSSLPSHSTGTGMAVVRTFARFFKVFMGAGLLLGGLFYLTKFILLPFYQEMKDPKKDGVDRKAPAAVQVLQQTRKVVAENNARMDKLNDIVDGMNSGEKPATNAPPPGGIPQITAVRPARSKAAKDDLLFQIQLALDAMKITGVTGGSDPRAVIDGRMVKFGDIVDYRLGLRFVEVNEEDHEVRFIDAEGTKYRRTY